LGELTSLPKSLAGFKGLSSKGREGKQKERKKGREGREKREKGKEKDDLPYDLGDLKITWLL